MIKIGKIKLGQIPRIAVSIADTENAKTIKSKSIDLLELRVDRFQKINPAYVSEVIKSRKKIGPPLILTIRNKKEGGDKSIPDRIRLQLFNIAIPLVNAVDIELNSAILNQVIKIAHKFKKVIIISYHNFKTTPNIKALETITSKAKRKGADIVKIATKANDKKDIIRLLEFTLRHKEKNLISISLGNIGAISRLYFPAMGSLLTYAYLDKPFGLGQLPLDILQKQLRLYYPGFNRSLTARLRLLE